MTFDISITGLLGNRGEFVALDDIELVDCDPGEWWMCLCTDFVSIYCSDLTDYPETNIANVINSFEITWRR